MAIKVAMGAVLIQRQKRQRRSPWLRSVPLTRGEGGFVEVIKTLSLNVKARFVTAEKDSEKAPDRRAFVGPIEIGAGWKRTAEETGREYFSMKLNDPSSPSPIYARLVAVEDGYVSVRGRGGKSGVSARRRAMPHDMELGARVSDGWSPGRAAKVEVQTLHPKPPEDPMTDERMALIELLQKSGEGDGCGFRRKSPVNPG